MNIHPVRRLCAGDAGDADRAVAGNRLSCSAVGISTNITAGKPAKVITSMTADEPVKSSPQKASSVPAGRPIERRHADFICSAAASDGWAEA